MATFPHLRVIHVTSSHWIVHNWRSKFEASFCAPCTINCSDLTSKHISDAHLASSTVRWDAQKPTACKGPLSSWQSSHQEGFDALADALA